MESSDNQYDSAVTQVETRHEELSKYDFSKIFISRAIHELIQDCNKK